MPSEIGMSVGPVIVEPAVSVPRPVTDSSLPQHLKAWISRFEPLGRLSAASGIFAAKSQILTSGAAPGKPVNWKRKKY